MIIISFGGNNSLEFWYDAMGNKVRKIVKTAGTTTLTHDYLGGIEVKNNKVEAIYSGVGRAFNTASSGQAYRYEYYLKDHLGNIRLSFTDKNNDGLINNQGEILQENQYYPFGMVQHGSWYDDATVANNPYLYNDKELTTDFGLNLSDYGARGYDAAIGRWWQVDPLVELEMPLSPYNYVANNPLKYIDPNGMKRVDLDGGNYYDDETGELTIVGRKPRSSIWFGMLSVAHARNFEKYGTTSPYQPYFASGGRDAALMVGAPLL